MKRKDIEGIIKRYFFINPTAKLRVRQIERELGLPLPSVIRYTAKLEKEGILKKLNTANVVFYAADRTDKTFLLEKKLFNIKQIYTSGLIDFLIGELSNPTIVLFGSYSKGEDTENSDIDLYIETPSKKEIKLEKFEKLLKRKIQVFRYISIQKITNHHLANNILNGTNLNGFVVVFK